MACQWGFLIRLTDILVGFQNQHLPGTLNFITVVLINVFCIKKSSFLVWLAKADIRYRYFFEWKRLHFFIFPSRWTTKFTFVLPRRSIRLQQPTLRWGRNWETVSEFYCNSWIQSTQELNWFIPTGINQSSIISIYEFFWGRQMQSISLYLLYSVHQSVKNCV